MIEGRWVAPILHRIAASAVAVLLVACGSQPDATPTPVPRESVAAHDRDRAQDAVNAFLEAMANPDVTYRVTGQLRVGTVDADGRPDVLINTRYDVKANEYGGTLDIHLRDPTVGGTFQLFVIDGMAHLWNWNAGGTISMDAPETLHRPDALRQLGEDDLTLLGITEDGLFEFAVAPWLGGDPLGEPVDVGAVPEGALPHTALRSHDTRLFLDATGAPARLVQTWSFAFAGEAELRSGTIVDEIEGLGMYVTLEVPGDFPIETSYDVITGVDADNVIVTEPWVEVRPQGGTASLDIAFPQPDRPVMLGIEGAILFIRSHDAEGELTLDRIVSPEGDTIEIPVGMQTLVAYYRTCDGNCALLDEAHDFCEVAAEMTAGRTYELTVEVHDSQRATCSLVDPFDGA